MAVGKASSKSGIKTVNLRHVLSRKTTINTASSKSGMITVNFVNILSITTIKTASVDCGIKMD